MSNNLIKILVSLTLLIVIVTLLSVCKDDWSDSKIQESQNRGNKIIEAFEKYKTENSLYPDKLDLVVPKYLTKIELPVCGNRIWQYGKYEDGSYKLGFKGDTMYDPECWWYDSKKYWWIDTK